MGKLRLREVKNVLVSGRVRTWTQVCFTPNPMLCPFALKCVELEALQAAKLSITSIPVWFMSWLSLASKKDLALTALLVMTSELWAWVRAGPDAWQEQGS